jgi:hypothetical protein
MKNRKYSPRLPAVVVSVVALCFSLACAGVYAHPHPPEGHPDGPNHPAHADLGSQATDPTAPLMSLRLQYQNNPSSYNADGYSQASIFQAVIPGSLPFESVPRAIYRTTTPYLSTPDLGTGVGRKNGFGDTSLLALGVPDFGLKEQTLALGGSFTIPTGGDNEYTGSGQWQAGPAVVYINSRTKGLQWGALLTQNWDVSSTRSDAEDVSAMGIQPILTYHFSEGWYVSSPDLPQVYNFKTNNWSTNLGLLVGRVFPWRTRHLQVFGAVYYNSEDHEDIVASEWVTKINISFLMPE